ncbi:hypothetical protein Q9966_008364 [Columba livia]|nr:hypothetical protein Q9966_008364 [Columba livia]
MMAGLKSHRMRTIFSIYAASYAKVTLPGFLCQKMEQKPWAGEGWLAARAQLASPLNTPGVEVDDKAAVGLIKINSALKENTWKNHIQHQQQEHRVSSSRDPANVSSCTGLFDFIPIAREVMKDASEEEGIYFLGQVTNNQDKSTTQTSSLEEANAKNRPHLNLRVIHTTQGFLKFNWMATLSPEEHSWEEPENRTLHLVTALV